MAGNKAGASKAVATIYATHGKDFYKKIGSLGGQKGTTGGFYKNKELASKVGAIGGKNSKRGPNPIMAENHDKVKMALENRMSIYDISKVFGINYSCAYNYVKRFFPQYIKERIK